jgi:Dinucleotide-utilizing enzymes involved in molybdopterin and thiamine biosynthesis family 1
MEILYGADVCKRLAQSRVLVCGLGAVGGYALEILARSGVGNFMIADSDVFDITNVSRQIGALESTVGKSKTQVMRARVLDINPAANVECFDSFIDANTIPQMLEYRPDIIVDAIDTIASKISLMQAAISCDIKLVASMGAARKTDASRVKTCVLPKTNSCPVAFKIRKELRRAGLKAKFNCVYSDEIPSEESHVASGSENSKKVIGSSPAITALFGVMLADLAIKEILNDAL